MTKDDVVLRVVGLSKRYRLGVINHGTLYRDLQSWWARQRGRPDPNVSIGSIWYSRKRIQDDVFCALEDVSFEVKRGEILGVIGSNGAGKSTLLKVISRITAPTAGRAYISGRVASLLEVGTGFHPELTGRENIYLNGAILGMSRCEVTHKFDEIVDFAEIHEFIDTPVKRYSSGMYVRLAFSVAAHLDADILLMDEVLAVGDAAFQKKCLGKMNDVGTSGRTILFVSHNMGAIEKLCDKALVLKDGRAAFHGEVEEALQCYHAHVGGTDPLNLKEVTRSGDGRLKIEAVWFSDAEGSPLRSLESGQRVKLHVAIDPQHGTCKNVVLSVGVTTPEGAGVLHLSTETVGFKTDQLSSPGIFTCTLPKLTLRGGHYCLNLFLTSSGQIADWIKQALAFQVQEGDFYGTGLSPPEGYSHTLADHAWEWSES